jgi:ABC-type transporter Mla subunit MlaD
MITCEEDLPMADRSLRVRLGGFVAAALAALSGLVVLFGGAPSVFTSRYNYVVLLPEAPGVSPGIPVRKSGVRIGQVTGLDIDESTGGVRVVIEVDQKYRPRTNEEPVLSRGLLNGDTTIDFVPKFDTQGKPLPRSDFYEVNAEIAGVPPVNPRALLSQAQGAIPNAQEALVRFGSALQRFEAVAPKAEKALDEISSLAHSTREIVPELRQTNLKIQDFIGSNDVDQPNNLKSLIKEVQEFVKALKPLADELRTLVNNNQDEFNKTLKGLRQLADNGNALLNPQNREAVQGILKNVKVASDDLLSEQNRKNVASILTNVKDGSDDLTKTIRLAGILVDRAETTLKEINARIAEAKGIFTNLEKATGPIAANAEPIMKNIAAASQQLSTTLTEVNKVIAAINRSEGTLNKILNDPTLYNALVESTASLNRTLIRAERIAKDLEVFADKVARKPETIGIGGVVRPSTGLKESPTAPLDPGTPYPPRYPATSGDGLRPTPIGPIFGGRVTPIPPVSSYRHGEDFHPAMSPLPRGKITPLQPSTPVQPQPVDDLPPR